MSEKKLTEEELRGVIGGAQYSLSAQKTEGRGGWHENAEGVLPDPLGGPQNDPIYSDVSEQPKG